MYKRSSSRHQQIQYTRASDTVLMQTFSIQIVVKMKRQKYLDLNYETTREIREVDDNMSIYISKGQQQDDM